MGFNVTGAGFSSVLHTIHKIDGEWFIWAGRPAVLRSLEAVAGPFHKRYEALEAAHALAIDREVE